MSLFFPYSVSQVLDHFSTLYNLDLSQLTDYESLAITIFANIYFFLFWFIIVYFSLKIFNRIWERFLWYILF